MSDPINLTHVQAVNRLKDIDDEMERFSAKEILTDADELRFAELEVEFDQVNEYRKGLEREAARARVSEVREGLGRRGPVQVERGTRGDDYDRDPVADPASAEDFRNGDPWNTSEIRMGQTPEGLAQEFRARALSAIEQMPGANDKVRAAATQILEEGVDRPDKLARQIVLTSSPAYMRAWTKLAKASGAPVSLNESEQRALNEVEAFRAMSLTDNAGGYLVPFQLDPTVIITSAGSRNDIRSKARQVVATGDVWNGVSSAEVSWSWDAEGAEVSDDATTFAQPTVPIHTARGFVPISLEAFQDAANVTTEVGRLLASGKDTLEATAFATGSGSGQPTGIVTALVGTSSEINAATDDTFAIADVRSLYNALPARYRTSASWLANNSIYTLIRAFDTSGGGGFWANLNGDRPEQLLGKDILEAEAMDGVITTSGAANNYALIFGDFENYVIADRIGMTVEFIPQLFHTSNNRPSGQKGWFATARMGADSVNDGAFRLLDVPSAS